MMQKREGSWLGTLSYSLQQGTFLQQEALKHCGLCSASHSVGKEQLCRKIRLWPVVIPFFLPHPETLLPAQAVCPGHM